MGGALGRLGHSPGLNNREWIETISAITSFRVGKYSPGLNNREWIETITRA